LTSTMCLPKTSTFSSMTILTPSTQKGKPPSSNHNGEYHLTFPPSKCCIYLSFPISTHSLSSVFPLLSQPKFKPNSQFPKKPNKKKFSTHVTLLPPNQPNSRPTNRIIIKDPIRIQLRLPISLSFLRIPRVIFQFYVCVWEARETHLVLLMVWMDGVRWRD
jgi:hypothetical protein